MNQSLLPSTFAKYFERYTQLVAQEPLGDVLAAETQESLTFWQGVSPSQTEKGYAAGKWSLKEMLQHIIDVERIFQYRALAFARQEPADLPGFDHQVYVQNSQAQGRSWSEILAEWEVVRRSTQLLFLSFTAAQLAHAGLAGGNKLSTAVCGYIIAGHEKHHRQIAQARYF
jgi:hypothetical protein